MRPALALPIGVVAVVLAVAFGVTPAAAQAPAPAAAAIADSPPFVLDLDLVLAPGARRCGIEERLHREVSRRIGYDIFQRGPSSVPAGRLTVRIAPEGNGLRARYNWVDPDGKSRWPKPKTYAEEGTDEITCVDLFKGIAVSLVAELPEPPLPVPAPAVQAPPVCAPAAAVAECPKTAPPVVVEVVKSRFEVEPARRTWVEPEMPGPDPLPGLGFRGGVSVFGEQYATGMASVGFGIDLGLRYRWFSAGVEGRGDPPLGSLTTQLGRVGFGRAMGGGLLCLHHRVLVFCGVGEVGRVLFSVAPPFTSAKSYDALGIRVGLELEAGTPRLLLRLQGEMLAPISPAIITHETVTLYQTAGVNGGLVLGILWAP